MEQCSGRGRQVSQLFLDVVCSAPSQALSTLFVGAQTDWRAGQTKQHPRSSSSARVLIAASSATSPVLSSVWCLVSGVRGTVLGPGNLREWIGGRAGAQFVNL